MTILGLAHRYMPMLSSADFHKDFLSLQISTHEIGVDGLRFARTLSKEAICALLFEKNTELFSWKSSSSVDVHFDIERENDHTFKVSVKSDFTLQSSCVRCLDAVAHKFSLDFYIRMLGKKHLAKETAESVEWQFDSNEVDMSSDEDLSVGYFIDQKIDLGIILREQIFYEAPDYPHCPNQGDSVGCKSIASKTQNAGEIMQDSPFLRLLNKDK